MIEDYIDSGFTVAGIVGIDGSPTCGVGKTLSVRKSLRYISGLSIDTLDRDVYNRNLYGRCLEEGSGIFIKALSGKLKEKGLEIRLFSLDLEDEMNGRKIHLGL
jgi:predicted secreted protein